MGAPPAEPPDVARAAAVATLGLRRDATPDDVDAAATRALEDDAPPVRAAAVGALVRAGSPDAAQRAWFATMQDDAVAVRRRSAELAPMLATRVGDATMLVPELVRGLGDPDTTVIESAAYALGELDPDAVGADAISALARTATDHADALAREAAVAALGALGDPAGLAAVLVACGDKVTVRRRAVLALAPFEGPEVDAALARALDDRDWQVRQAAEDLTTPPTTPPTAPTPTAP